MRRVSVGLACLALLLLAVGCSPPPAPIAGSTDPGGAAPASSGPLPVTVSIPSINVDSPPLIPLGLDGKGELQVPPVETPGVGGWYADGVRPGDRGAAVIAAHINGRVKGKSTPGLFARLAELHPGATVTVTRADGTKATFTVTQVAHYPKLAGIPPSVYADTPRAELRLITCGGRLNQAAHSYDDNIIAFAKAT